jgi:2-C-methyl-D-erythritol 2,4-cyclodiphosphate synthase
MKLKTGIGYDVHQLANGFPLFLGGVRIDYERGAVGHSDADVALHAIIDALFGAANLRDIGYNYPDSDIKYKDIDSKILLADCVQKIVNKGFVIQNIDCTICLQSPKISQYIPLMQQTITSILRIDTDDVSIKATTTEKLGFVGRNEGVAAYCVVLLLKDV